MKRRLLSFVLAFAMLLSVTPVAVFASGTAVAKIGDTEYGTLAEALEAAADGATIELIWADGDAPIAMAGSVVGNKTITITGTATVDWSKGWLFVGRGGEGDGKLIFNNANLTAYANSGRDVGIHVSGHEKGSTTKNNGTVEMINSNIELDYLINKGTMVVDNTVLYVHAGFGIAGRPASETEDGKDATATITIKNGSNVTVKNVDISRVAADPINVVWVDEANADDFNDVTVNGGRPAIEGDNGAIEGLNYASLGDSMSNGYGLPGYNANNGVEDYGDQSYANQFATWLAQNNGAVVNHAQLAMSAMRAEDLHWLLEVDYNDPAVIAVIEALEGGNWDHYGHLWNETFTNGDYWTWRELVHDYRFDIAAAYIEKLESAYNKDLGATVTLNCITNGTDMTEDEKDAIYDHYTDVEALTVVAKYYQESVANADVISLGMGNGNFGVFMFGRIMEAIGFGGTPDEAMIYDVERAIAECPANVQHEILVLKDQLYDLVESKVGMSIESNPTLKALANTVVYTGLSYVLNYAGSVEAILQRNPDAEIILVALMNTFNDPAQASRAIPGVEDATLGDLLNVVFTPLNAYIAALPTYMQATGNSVYANATFYYAEADRVECLVEVYEDEIQTNAIIRDRFVTDIVGEAGDLGMIWGLATPLFSGIDKLSEYGLALVPITSVDVENYKAGTCEDMTPSVIFSCAIYSAFEGAICSASSAPVSINSILGLGSLSGDLFGGVGSALMSGLDFDDIADEVTAKVTAAGAADVTAYVTNHYADYVAFCTAQSLVEADTSTNGPLFYCYANSITDPVAHFTEKYASYYTALVLGENITPLLKTALNSDPTVNGLLGLYGRCVIGNGLGSHPSVTGHEALYNAVINAYDTGYTAEDQTKENLKVAIPAAYAQAYKYAKENGYIDMAKNYIDIASGAVLAADNYVHTLVVPTQLEQTRVLLQEELANTLGTLAEAKALLDIAELTPETWAQILAMESELYIHMATLEDLAAELGIVGDIALDQIGIVVDYYAGVIDTIANDAYAWVANGVTEFNQEYAAWVESVGQEADKIDPALGAAVRAYLTETPAEALAIMYAAGEDAVVEFIAATAAASEDIKVIITAISAILESDIDAIANAVKNSAEVAAIIAQIDQVKGEIKATVAEMQQYPVTSVLAYQRILGQLQKQLTTLQGELVDAILNSIDDVDPTLRPLLNKALAALKDAAYVAAGYGTEYGAWFDARFDEMLGDLLALLIDKTNEFGSIAGPILGETIDNFVRYVGNLAYEKGMEILDKVENEIIPEFIDTLKDYGAQAWAKIVAKLDALGVLDAVNQAQKDLNDLYELINSYITEDLADVYDTVLDRIGEIKENIAGLIETVRTELENTSEEELRATLAALQEKLENLYDAILALEDVVNEAMAGNINAAIAMAQTALNNVADAVADLAGVLSEEAAAAVTDLVDDVKVMLNEAYIDAITDTYTVAPDSYYVALGDSSVYGEDSYAQKLAAELGLTKSQFINLSVAGMSVADSIGVVTTNADEIAKADLITIGFSNTTMMEFVIAQLKASTGNGEAQPMDWTALVGEKLVPHVEKALADITADVMESGLDAQYADLMTVAVEAYAYAAVSYALHYPAAVQAIHEINPDALVVIVGMHNPLAGVSVKISETESIAIGDYVQSLIELANMETLAYAMLAPNTIYVDAPAVETGMVPGEITAVNFIFGLLTGNTDKYYATDAGHAYVAQQILNALTITKSGLLGDVNNDGVVELTDAILVLQYYANVIGADGLSLHVADVSGDSTVDITDAILLLQYYAGVITNFPAEIQ